MFKFFSNFVSVFGLQNARSKIVKHAKSRKAKVIFGLTGTGAGFYYLYRTDSDALVEEFPHSFPITIYRILPFCTLSRFVGSLSRKEIPVWLRKPILGSFVSITGCDMSEARIEDVVEYKSLSDLFQRQLKWGCRPVDRQSDLISPCDGKVLYCGEVINDKIEQVKGVTFSMKGFLGQTIDDILLHVSNKTSFKFPSNKHQSIADSNALFYCIIYLAPGDYHRFHSPADIEFTFRRYFPGKLLSVHPVFARFIPGLFSVNERVAYFGQWKYGLFSYSAVGAANVGNLSIFCDDIPLNADKQMYTPFDKFSRHSKRFAQLAFTKEMNPPIKVSPSQLFGMFNLGSTIVLIFEAPKNFQFSVKPGSPTKMGSAIGNCPKK